MVRSLRLLLIVLLGTAIGLPSVADVTSSKNTLSSVKITKNTSPEIKKLYDDLSALVSQHDNLTTQYESDLQENLNAMRETEQSLGNRILGAASIGATGIGAMQLASGLAEQNADEDAARDMAAYMATFTCRVGDTGALVEYEQNYTLPPAGADFAALKTEYKNLAAQLKETKEALGLPPGIEAEEILDAATGNLYEYDAASAKENNLATVADRLESGESSEKIKAGAITAGVGVVGGIIGNAIINKDSPEEKSAELKQKFDAESKKIESDIDTAQRNLSDALDKNAQQIKLYNELLQTHRANLTSLCGDASPCFDKCREQYTAYAQYVNSLTEITDPTQSVDVDATKSELETKFAAWKKCVDDENARQAELERKRRECENAGNQWTDDKCVVVAKPVQEATVTTATTTPVAAVPATETNTPEKVDDTLCPDENLRFQGAKGKHVGDFCSYGNVAEGKIIKFTTDNKTKTPHQIKGQCTCSPVLCKTGYGDENRKPVNGACNERKQQTTTQSSAYEPDLKYYAVCGDDEGKSDGKEICIEGVFEKRRGSGYNLNTGVMQAIAFGEEYIKHKYKLDARCSNDYRKTGGDAYLKCTALDNKTFFEIRFDDLEQSIDAKRETDQRQAICYVYGMKATTRNNTHNGCLATKESECGQLKKLANRLAYDVKFEKRSITTTSVQGTAAQAVTTTDTQTACWIDNRDDLYKVTYQDEKQYYAVCDKNEKGKSGGKEICIEGVFENGWTKTGKGFDLKTSINESVLFAETYIKQKYNTDITCSKNHREAGNDAFVKCANTDNKTFFEVRFDNITETRNESSEKGAVCHINNMKSITANGNATGCRATSASECQKLTPIANKLSYQIAFGTKQLTSSSGSSVTGGVQYSTADVTGCWIEGNASSEVFSITDSFAKIDGLNNLQFYGIHSLNKSIPNAVRDYVQGVKGKNTTVSCDNNTTIIDSIYGKADNDEVLRCSVNGTPIDFAFDDTTELFWYERRAGESGLGCAALGGTYTGRACIAIDEAKCNEAADRLAQTCPKCKKPEWEKDKNRCLLPSSRNAANFNMIGQVTGMTIMIVAGVTVTIISGGAAGAPAWLGFVEAVGGVMEITAQILISTGASSFLNQTAQCGGDNCANCAEDLLKKLRKHIAQATDYQNIEIAAIDSELSRLLTCLPDDSELLAEIGGKIENGIMANNNGIMGPWSWEQVMRAVGGVLGLASFVDGLIHSATKTGAEMSQTASTINRRITAIDKDAARAANKLDNMTPGSAAYTKQAAKVDELAEQQKIVDRAAAGTLTDADKAEIAADGNKTLRHSVDRVTTQTKSAKEIANDGGKLKEYDQLLAKQNRSVSENQRLNEIRNSWGSPSDDVIAAARVEQTKIADAAEIQKARDELAKYDEWAAKNPGAAKNQTKTRQAEIDKLRKKVADADAAAPAPRPVDASTPKTTADNATSNADNVADAAKGTTDTPTPASASKTDAPSTNTRTRTGTASTPTNNNIVESDYVPPLKDIDTQTSTKKALENFLADPYKKQTSSPKYSMRGDVASAITREMAIEDGILFIDPYSATTSSDLASVISQQTKATDKTKAMLGNVYMSHPQTQELLPKLIQNLDAQGIKKASIPFSSDGHSMLLVKEGNKYTILDQYAYGTKEVLQPGQMGVQEAKDLLKKALKQAGVKDSDIVHNIPQICDNMNGTCNIYSNLSAQAAMQDRSETIHDTIKAINAEAQKAKVDNIVKFWKPKTEYQAHLWEDLVMDNADVMPGYAERALKRFTDTASDITRVTDTTTDASRAISRTDDIASLRKRASDGFELYANDVIKTNGKKSYAFPSERLTDAEWQKLNASLADDGLELVDTGLGTRVLEKIKTAAPADNAATAARNADNAAAAARNIDIDFGADIVQRTGRSATLRGGNTRPYNYYFVDIDGMVRSDVQKIMDELTANGYDDVFIMQDNGKFVVNASNPTIRGGQPINNSNVQQYGINYISRTKGANIADDAANTTRARTRTSTTALRNIERKLGSNISDVPEGHMIAGSSYQKDWTTEEINILRNELDKRGLTLRAYTQRDGSGSYVDGIENWFVIKKDGGTRHLPTKDIPSLDEPITNIHGHDVFVETIPGSGGQKVGMVSGRPVVVVNVNGRRIPMYASTGSAGKLDVPTGKWEFIAGIEDRGGSSGWFNKGTLEQILNHYNSPELKQIAAALDATIGDVRNVEDIVASASRRAYNGKGFVGMVDNLYNLNTPSGLRFINDSFSYTPVASNSEDLINMYDNIKETREFLRDLTPPTGKKKGGVDNTTKIASNATRSADNTTRTRTGAGNTTAKTLTKAEKIDAARSADNIDNISRNGIHWTQDEDTVEKIRKFATTEFKTPNDVKKYGGLNSDALEELNKYIADVESDKIDFLDIYQTRNFNTNSTKNLWTSLQTPETNIDDFIHTVQSAMKHKRAAIPMATDGHVMTLVKDDDNWAIVDQFGPESFTNLKSVAKEVLNGLGVKPNNIVETTKDLTGASQNINDCFAYSSQVSWSVLSGVHSLGHILNIPFTRSETDEFIALMQLAASKF